MKIKKGGYKVVIDDDTEGLEKSNPTDSPTENKKNWASGIQEGKPGKFEVKKKVKEMVSKAAKLSGNMPEAVKKMLSKIENPQVTWKKLLQRYISEVSQEPAVYKIPNRRYVADGYYLPGLRGKEEGHGNLVIAIDTSCLLCQNPNCNYGMSGNIFGPFLKEAMGVIKNFKGENIYVVYSSDGIDGVDFLKTAKQPLDRNKMNSTGGNSNSFNPVFTWIEKNIFKKGEDLDCLVYLTDGYVNKFPTKPIWAKKIIWCMVSKVKAPYGKNLFIPTKGHNHDYSID